MEDTPVTGGLMARDEKTAREGLRRQLPNVEAWLVTGAALYWSSIIVQFLLPGSAASSGTTPMSDVAARYLMLATVVAAGFLVPRAFTSERGRVMTVACIVACSAIMALPSAPVGNHMGTAWGLVQLLANRVAIAALMVDWGLAFASLDKHAAGRNVAATSLLAVLVTLVTLLISPFVPVRLLSIAGMAASALVIGTGHVRLVNRRRTRSPEAHSSLRSFLFSRLAFGLVMGTCIEAPFTLHASDADPALAALGCLAVIGTLLAYGRATDRLYALLPALLFLSIGVTYLPFFKGGLDTAAGAAAGLVWACWAVFSAFQLSDLKERCGVSELGICLVEKCVLSASIALGVLTWRGCATLLDGMLSAEAIEHLLFAGTFAVVMVSAYGMASLVNDRKTDEIRAELARTRQELADASLDTLASQHGLSAREREVLAMLSEGYTRAYIREALGISDGTAKAHIAHVYAKLEVHRKDDLLALVERCMGQTPPPRAE